MSKKSEPMKEHSQVQAALACGEAFQRLTEELISKIGSTKEESSQAMSNELADIVACAANLAFAIELYLKALLILLDLEVPQVHNLRVLYDKIPQKVRELVESVYDTAWPDQARQLHGRVSITLAKGPLSKPQWDDYIKKSFALPDLLSRSKNIFQSWRYIFEFRQPNDSSYQFHQFEYGLLWCAAEAIKAEIKVRSGSARQTQTPNPIPDDF
jgi:CheY-like chemotaxis protein